MTEGTLRAPSQFEIRDELQRLVPDDLLGPAGGPEEEVAEDRVSERYLVGMLAPRLTSTPPEESDTLAVGGYRRPRRVRPSRRPHRSRPCFRRRAG